MTIPGHMQIEVKFLKSWQVLMVGIGLAAIAVITAADVVADLKEGTSFGHLSLEFSTITICSLISGWLLKQIYFLKAQVNQFQTDAEHKGREARRWQQEAEVHLKGVGEAIEKQLQEWCLTPSEQDVVFLMLKGLAYKDIAALRNVTEKTVRQQALSVFRKSGVGGRTELAAFFLEDLLPPRPIQTGQLKEQFS